MKPGGTITGTGTGRNTVMLEFDFMRNAFLAAAIVAVASGAVGYFLVLRGQSFAGHGLAHVGFTGATGAVLFGAPPLLGLVLLTVLGGIGMGLLGGRVQERDVAIGIVLSVALGFGLLFLHFFTAYASQATALLFGNVLGVDDPTLWGLLVLAFLSVGALAAISRPLLFATFSPSWPRRRASPCAWSP
jgi:zinc/manganese transport system permease protein